jgi:hypothetical protein
VVAVAARVQQTLTAALVARVRFGPLQRAALLAPVAAVAALHLAQQQLAALAVLMEAARVLLP